MRQGGVFANDNPQFVIMKISEWNFELLLKRGLPLFNVCAAVGIC